jgi:hypothetical protein|tara:strand:+ start:560 stop:826 length:267 start_codon:yes stop_codon:yes gene_type:complete
MAGNYPDGVTGNEYAIAGPDSEWEEELYCEKCQKDTLFGCESFRGQRSGICDKCGSDVDLGHRDDYIDYEDVAEQREDLEEHRNEMGW